MLEIFQTKWVSSEFPVQGFFTRSPIYETVYNLAFITCHNVMVWYDREEKPAEKPPDGWVRVTMVPFRVRALTPPGLSSKKDGSTDLPRSDHSILKRG